MQLTSKGQVTIPQAIREALALLPGTTVEARLRVNRAVPADLRCQTSSSVHTRPSKA